MNVISPPQTILESIYTTSYLRRDMKRIAGNSSWFTNSAVRNLTSRRCHGFHPHRTTIVYSFKLRAIFVSTQMIFWLVWGQEKLLFDQHLLHQLITKAEITVHQKKYMYSKSRLNESLNLKSVLVVSKVLKE